MDVIKVLGGSKLHCLERLVCREASYHERYVVWGARCCSQRLHLHRPPSVTHARTISLTRTFSHWDTEGMGAVWHCAGN